MSPAQSPVEVPPGAALVADRPRVGRTRFRHRGGGLYLPLAERNALAIAAAPLWAAISLVISLPWIDALGQALSLPVAIVIVAGIAILPGYLNAHLVVSLMFDRPPPLRDDGPRLRRGDRAGGQAVGQAHDRRAGIQRCRALAPARSRRRLAQAYLLGRPGPAHDVLTPHLAVAS